MATEVETLQAEVDAREDQIANLKLAEINRVAQLAEANQLDSNLKGDQEATKATLESVYTEQRHYNGKEPLVYTQTQSDVFPYYQGALDVDANPYYRPQTVIAGLDTGIAPIESAPDRTGPVGIGRDQSFAPTEDVNRTPVIQPLKDYPDLSAEPLPPGFPAAQQTNSGADQCFYAAGGDQSTCESNGGEWVLNGALIPDPTWVGPNTAPGIVRPLLTSWRADVILILADVHDDDVVTEAFWQDIIDECDDFLAELPSDAVFVRNTGNADPTTWGQTGAAAGALLTAINNLITLSETSTPPFVTSRDSVLDGLATSKEDIHFDIIKLRLHSVNGSFSKVKAIEAQGTTEQEIIDDHQSALESLNRLIISKS